MTEAVFSTWGALAGLAVAIVLIVRKVTPAYSLVLGALVGGLLGGGGLPATVEAMPPIAMNAPAITPRTNIRPVFNETLPTPIFL